MCKNELNSGNTTQNKCRGIPTGFVGIDEATGGFMPGELIVLTSLPSKGKSSLALSMLRYIAIEKKTSAGFISLKIGAEITHGW